MTRMELARRLRGLTQDDLALRVRIHQAFISLIERGKGLPEPDQRRRLALELNLHPDELLQPVTMADAVPTEPQAVQGSR